MARIAPHRLLRTAGTLARALAVAALIAGAAPAHADGAAAAVEQNARLPADGGTAISREYLIKAALLYNFAKFAEWPARAFASADAPLRICVLGDDPFGAALDTLLGKQVRERPLAIARVDAPADTARCQILFVSASEAARLPAILAFVATRPILTVADIDRFARAGGIIGLKTVNNRSRIEVNIDAVNRAGLKLSSKLLRLADTVGAQTAQATVAPR